MSRRRENDFEEGEEVEEEKEIENENDDDDNDVDDEDDSEEEEGEEEEEEEVAIVDKPKGGQGGERLVRSERVNKEISEEIVESSRPRVGGKEPRKEHEKILKRRIVENFTVVIPKLEAKVEGWADVLDSEWGSQNDHLFEEMKASCQMRDKDGAVHMIAYFCSILNADPSYIDPFFCYRNGFELREQTAKFMDDPNEVMYYEFRTVFGVVIAYIAGYLMHYHIEITLAMHDDEFGCRFINTGKFIHWDSDVREFEFTAGANDSNYNPHVMKYISPYNFYQSRWDEFEGIVNEVVAEFKTRNWPSFAAEVYQRTAARFNFLRRPWVKNLRYLWRGHKTELCLGLARSAAQRKTIEKGEPPYDFLMETQGGHRIEHAKSPGIPWEFARPDIETWDIRDVYPTSPDTIRYDLPGPEKELRDRQNPKKRKGTAATSDAPSGIKDKSKKARTAGTSSSSLIPAREKAGNMWNDPQQQRPAAKKPRGQPSEDGDNDDDFDELSTRGPVLKEMKEWEEIKGGLVGLAKSLPKLIGWIDNSLNQRMRHSIKAKQARKNRLEGPRSAEKNAPPNTARRLPQAQTGRTPQVLMPPPLIPPRQTLRPIAQGTPASQKETDAEEFARMYEMYKAHKAAGAHSSSSSSSDATSAIRPLSATSIAASILGDYATAGRSRAAGASTDAEAEEGDDGGGPHVEVLDSN